MFIYLAGAMSWYKNNNRLQEVFEWRNKFTEYINCPIRRFEIYNACKNYFEIDNKLNDATIVRRDLLNLKKADILVVNTNYLLSSPGTMFELSYFYINQKPVFGFGDKNIFDNAYIRELVPEFDNQMDGTIKKIRTLYA